MHKKLQQILKELTEISGIRFALYESPEEYVEGTLTENALSEKQLEELFSGAEVDNENLVPVASASRNHICHITAVVREVNVLQRHCSVVGESVGVKHQSGLAVE